jgi:hypothetical protein
MISLVRPCGESGIGRLEQSAHSRLSHYCVARDYWKDGVRQTGIELLECSFTVARRAVMDAAGPCDAEYVRYSGRYEFIG